jgi:hypothetical protein
MADAKHTPGPWRARKVGDEVWIGNGKNDLVCCIQPSYGEFRPEHVEGNARLIAAAPDLLVACQAVMAALASYEEGIGLPPDVWFQVEAVIAKATGAA